MQTKSGKPVFPIGIGTWNIGGTFNPNNPTAKYKGAEPNSDNEEAEIGLRCIASPIRNDEGVLVAGLSISAPTERHNPAWVTMLKKTAEDFSRALGYAPAARS